MNCCRREGYIQRSETACHKRVRLYLELVHLQEGVVRELPRLRLAGGSSRVHSVMLSALYGTRDLFLKSCSMNFVELCPSPAFACIDRYMPFSTLTMVVLSLYFSGTRTLALLPASSPVL